MKNPFDFSNKVKKPELFFGRRELLRKLYQTLNTLGKCSIVGPRRIGKSSLLYQLTLPDWYSSYLDEPDSYIFAFIDLQLLATSDANHFLNMLVKRLCAASHGRLQTSLKEHDTQQFVNFLEGARADSLKLVLCCDEFESLNRDKGFKCDENFFFFLRGILNEYDVTMITSSQVPLSELCNTSGLPTSPLWNIFINFPLNLMTENEARSLIADPFARCNQILVKDDIDFIYDVAGPHPFFIQMASYFAFECMTACGHFEYPKIERQFFDAASEHYAHVWNKLNDEKKNGLRRFVQCGDAPNEVAFKKLKAEAIINDQNQLSSRGWRWFIERQLQRTTVSSPDHLTKEVSVASDSLNRESPLQERAARNREIDDSSATSPQRKKVFISYSWDNDDHKNWVRALATRLRSDGIDVTLDQWHLVPGDQLSEFMERAVHESDYVLIVCTHKYKERSNKRQGGVGYEGDIISAEFMATRNSRKFIPILRQQPWLDSAPSWMLGKYYIDLSSSPYAENNYDDLLTTLLGKRQKAPPVGT